VAVKKTDLPTKRFAGFAAANLGNEDSLRKKLSEIA
jgi:hypothetical protein